MFGEHALAFVTARLTSKLPSPRYRYSSSCFKAGRFYGEQSSASNIIKSQNSCSSCRAYCCAPAPVWAGVLLAICLSFAPVKGGAQETNIQENPPSQHEEIEAGQVPLTKKIDRLEGQVKQLTEDFKDLATIAKDGDTSEAIGTSWVAVMAKLQERLRVIEHTLTDLTERTEQLERFGGGRAAGSSNMTGDDGEITHAQGLFNKANNLLRERKVEQAIEAFKKFVQNYPSDERIAEVMFYLGESYAVMQDNKQAADAFLNGYKKNRKGEFAPKLLLRLGQTLVKLKKNKQACRVLKEFKKHFANKDEQLDAIVESEIAANTCSTS